MSPNNYKLERVLKNEARKQIAKIIKTHPDHLIFSGHALRELQNDLLTTADAFNVLQSPHARIHSEGEFEHGSYRYRLKTTHLVVVVSFWNDGDGINIITAWDKRKGGK